jgi:hypothetical protein
MIGAAVYFTIEDFDRSISDCDRAIELNKAFVKVINRKPFLLQYFEIPTFSFHLTFD